MVIDLILDRKDGEPYDPKHFYNECMEYSAIFDGMFDAVTAAMDYGTEKDVKEALCKYIKDCEYNPEIMDYINSVNWIESENPNGKFELWFGCLGNGTTVCNKAVEVNGDYKTIAHISNGGNIHFYVPMSYIPTDAMEKINAMASRAATEYHGKFEQLPIMEQYRKIIDALPYQVFMENLEDKRPLSEKLPELRGYYYAIV